MSPEAMGRVFAELLTAASAASEDRLSRIEARLEKLEAQTTKSISGSRSGWMTPPAAAEARGITTKRVRALMDSGAIEKRAKNPGAKQIKWEINVASLDVALAGDGQHRVDAQAPVNAASWAAARASRKAAT